MRVWSPVLDNPGYHRPQGLPFNEFALCEAVNIDTGGTKGKLVQMPKTCFFRQSLTSASVLFWFLFVSFVGFGFILFRSALAWRLLSLGVKLEGRSQPTGSDLNKPVPTPEQMLANLYRCLWSITDRQPRSQVVAPGKPQGLCLVGSGRGGPHHPWFYKTGTLANVTRTFPSVNRHSARWTIHEISGNGTGKRESNPAQCDYSGRGRKLFMLITHI